MLRYARALSKANSADLVVLPCLSSDHRRGLAHILIGPSSQLLSVPMDEIGIDLEDRAMVEILESRTLNIDPDRPEWGNDIVDVDDFTNFDWNL